MPLNEIKYYRGKKKTITIIILVTIALVLIYSIAILLDPDNWYLELFLYSIALGTLALVASERIPSTRYIKIHSQGLDFTYIDLSRAKFETLVNKKLRFLEIQAISSDTNKNILYIETPIQTYALGCQQMEEVMGSSRRDVNALIIEKEIANFVKTGKSLDKQKLRFFDTQIMEMNKHPSFHKYLLIAGFFIVFVLYKKFGIK